MGIFRLSTAGLFLCFALGASESLPIKSGDILGFVGGADVVAAQFSGHLEALLTTHFEGVRFRSFAWEGDTVYAQAREVGFPSVHDLLKTNAVTVLIVQFGRTEALEGVEKLASFKAAYTKLLEKFSIPRVMLVTPAPYETPGGLLPDLARKNVDLEQYVQAIASLAKERDLRLVDVFHRLRGTNHHDLTLTDNGLQLTERGHALVADAFAKEVALAKLPQAASFEQLRQAIIAKNKLWFNYSRPENWAFLGGDRVHVPSSHDHVDPKIRWFPTEMARFLPLIEAKEKEIAVLRR